MAKKQILTICLKDGSSVSCLKPYNYFDHGTMVESMEKAKDDDLISFKDGYGEEVLIPKKNISFIKVMRVECEEDTKEVKVWEISE